MNIRETLFKDINTSPTGENPDFWTAVVSLSAAFLVAAAIATVTQAEEKGFRTLAVIVPALYAVAALIELARRRPPPRPIWVLIHVAIMILIEATLLETITDR